jgi:starch-binding outer membrane protein, SusD/RagB family
MNKSTLYILLLVMIMITSCESLELDPQNSTTEESFYTNAENLNAGLYGIYDALQLRGICGIPELEGMSDNCIPEGVFLPDISAYSSGERIVATNTVVRMYRDNYVLIQRANLLLDKIDGINAIADADREVIRAEAKALRAFSYMRLVYLFGGVPLLKTFTDRQEILKVSRSDRTAIITFVMDELENVAAVLGNTPVTDGRLTKQAVLGFYAKIMLYEARLGNESWPDALVAINLALAEADKGGHGLVDTDNPDGDYQSLFMETNEGNKEFIFSVKNSSTDPAFSYKEDYSWQAGHQYLYIHQNLADAYGYADGSAYNPSDDTYVGRDPRLSANIMHRGLSFNGLTYDGTDNGGFVGGNSLGTATNLFFFKFITTDYSSDFNEGELDIPLLRYADLLLMQAEALNETDGDAYTPLNQVRDRAGLPALSGLSKGELKEKIILERRLELALEGHRWFDLITLGIAGQVINAIVEERSDIVRAFTPNRSELLPIPQTEIGLNPNITQNPGYEK